MLAKMYIWPKWELIGMACLWLLACVLCGQHNDFLTGVGVAISLVLAVWFVGVDPHGAATMRGAMNWQFIAQRLDNAVWFNVLRISYWLFFPSVQIVGFALAWRQRDAQREIWRQATALQIDLLEREMATWKNPALNPDNDQKDESETK